MSLFGSGFTPFGSAFARVAGELFELGGTHYTAISVEELTVEMRGQLGGIFEDANTLMLISADVLAASGIVKGSIVTVLGQSLRAAAKPQDDGTGTYWIPLGPVGLGFPRR